MTALLTVLWIALGFAGGWLLAGGLADRDWRQIVGGATSFAVSVACGTGALS